MPQKRQPAPKGTTRPQPKGVTFEPSKLILLAVVFLTLGVLMGWFMHATFAPNRAAAPSGMAGMGGIQAPAPAVSNRDIEVIEDHIEEAETQLLADPTNAENQIHLGNLYYDLSSVRQQIGDAGGAQAARQRAIQHYEQARQAGAANADMLTDLGTMYFRANQPGRAVAAYQAALDADPRHLNALMNMGVVKRQALNDREGAIAAWMTYLELSPNGAESGRVRTWLGELGVSVPAN